jgi:predicted 3-demethylubiquinone-9 3-methyltransferase (glyoxalase superfamily)
LSVRGSRAWPCRLGDDLGSELNGRRFVALNGGPQHFGFDESISFMVNCSSAGEVDHYWAALTDAGEEIACGWLKDRYGLRWQVVQEGLPAALSDPGPQRARRAMEAVLEMTKLDLGVIEAAKAG